MENSEMNVYEKLLEIKEVINNAKDIRKGLYKQLSELDLEVNDIYHYIEFSECNVVDIVKMHYVLKEVLKKRRQVKDMISTISFLIPDLVKASKNDTLKKLASFEEDENKYYVIRTDILSEALGNEVLKKDSKFCIGKEEEK